MPRYPSCMMPHVELSYAAAVDALIGRQAVRSARVHGSGSHENSHQKQHKPKPGSPRPCEWVVASQLRRPCYRHIHCNAVLFRCVARASSRVMEALTARCIAGSRLEGRSEVHAACLRRVELQCVRTIVRTEPANLLIRFEERKLCPDSYLGRLRWPQ
jgi:hypothetical protein